MKTILMTTLAVAIATTGISVSHTAFAKDSYQTAPVVMPQLDQKDAKKWEKALNRMEKGTKSVAQGERDLEKADKKIAQIKRELRRAQGKADEASSNIKKAHAHIDDARKDMERLRRESEQTYGVAD